MKVYLVIGCPGSGKTWVCEQLTDKFNYVPHDLFIDQRETYLDAISRFSKQDNRALIVEAPFSLSKIIPPLKDLGFDVEQVFIQEDHSIIAKRYRDRENKDINTGHLTRQRTYLIRAKEGGHFYGTSQEVLEHLRSK